MAIFMVVFGCISNDVMNPDIGVCNSVTYDGVYTDVYSQSSSLLPMANFE